MGYIILILGSSILLGWIISEVFRTFEKNDMLQYKITSIVMSILCAFILIFFIFGLKEEIRYNALNEYLDGKIEVVECIDTVRSFKLK